MSSPSFSPAPSIPEPVINEVRDYVQFAYDAARLSLTGYSFGTNGKPEHGLTFLKSMLLDTSTNLFALSARHKITSSQIESEIDQGLETKIKTEPECWQPELRSKIVELRKNPLPSANA